MVKQLLIRKMGPIADQDCDDCIQDAAVILLGSILQGKMKYEGVPQMVVWLTTTASRCLLNIWRVRRHEESKILDVLASSEAIIEENSARAARAVLQDLLDEVIDALPSDQQDLLRMKSQGITLEAISRKIGSPVSTIHDKYKAILLRVRAHFGSTLASELLIPADAIRASIADLMRVKRGQDDDLHGAGRGS